jgi:triosephosphate isomerase
MREPIIAGNWKMNNNIEESEKLIIDLKALVKDVEGVEIVVAPPFTVLSIISSLLIGTNMKLAAQNMHFASSGAFTGEISSSMLSDAGCEYVILGHSERRSYFAETNDTVNKKIKAAFDNGLIPIVCVGESLAQREDEKTFEVIEVQLKEGLSNIPESCASGLVIAYEPLWAIGTGKTATKEQAQQVHAFIRKKLSTLFTEDIADSIRILYGGSVKPENVDALMSQSDIDGALVGGAALKAESFARIIKFE